MKLREFIYNIFSLHLAREEHPHTGGLGGGQANGEREEGESRDCARQVRFLLSHDTRLRYKRYYYSRAGASLANGMNVHLNSDRK